MDLDEREKMRLEADRVKANIKARRTAEQERSNTQASRLLSRGGTRSERDAQKKAKPKSRLYRQASFKRARVPKNGFTEWCFGMFFKTLLFGVASGAAVVLILGLRMLSAKFGVHWVGDF